MQLYNRFFLNGVALALILLLSNLQAMPGMLDSCPTSPTRMNSNDVLVAGGQNGTWFQTAQYPRLFKIVLAKPEAARLATFESQGTIWSGSSNGSEWLISGWGSNSYGANPPIVIYDSLFAIVYSSSFPNSNSSWYGGDIFASSYSGHEWLLSGMGSGQLVGIYGNHMTLATLNGSNFTDLSSMIPNNQVGILYANEWNGSLWMVGGGYRFNGELFTFNGTAIHDLAKQIPKSVPTFGPVTSLAWNGSSWLIGGNQFLAMYSGHKFIDMTSELIKAAGAFHSVNAISWDKQDSTWLLAGGLPKADVRSSSAWIATLSSNGKATNLSTLLSCYLKSASSTSILTTTFDSGLWALGGYATYGKQISPILLVVSLRALTVTNFSHALRDTTYVIWVKFSDPNQPISYPHPTCEPTNEWTIARCT